MATTPAAGTGLQRWQAPAAAPRAIGYGLTATRDVRRVEVPTDFRRDLVIGQSQPLRCFEEALRYVMVHADHHVRLVHGFVVEDGRPWPHRWAEIGRSVVYCPTVGLFFDRDSYYQVLRAAPLVVYTPQEAADHATREGGGGPWADGNDAYLEVIAGLFGWFHTNHPDLLDWVQRMRACDASFACDFDVAIPANLIALVYLLQDLERHPERWRDHEPGRVPWPYRLRVQNAT